MRRVAIIISWIVGLAIPALTFVWAAGERSASRTRDDVARRERVTSAQLFLEAELRETRWGLARLSAFVATDSRVRASLSTTPLDPATLKDALDEVDETADAELLALLSPTGTVLAVRGGPAFDELKNMKLASADELTQLSENKPVTQLWFRDQAAVLVSLRPIFQRDSWVGVTLVGQPLGRAPLVSMANVQGLVVGFQGAHGEWFGSGPLEAGAAVESQPSEVVSDVRVGAVDTRPLTSSNAWIPFVCVAVLAVWTLVLANTRWRS